MTSVRARCVNWVRHKIRVSAAPKWPGKKKKTSLLARFKGYMYEIININMSAME